MSMSTPPSKRKKNETDNHMSVASTSTTSTQEQQSSITTLVEITAASSICADEAAQDTTLVEITTASSKCADEASQGMSSVDITGPGTPPRVSHYEPYTSTPRVERFLVDSEESELVDISFISVTSGLAPLIERQPGLAKKLKTIETQTTERRFVENSSQTDANPVDIIVSEIMEGKLDDTAMISICAAVGTFLKKTLEPGVPTLPAWQRSARANDALIRNRRSVYDRLTIPDPAEQKSAIFKFALEVQMVRTMIRKTGWIEPQEAKTMTSISGKPLHPDVLDFYSIAAGNYDRYLSNPEAEMQPIFVTEADKAAYQDSANWTVKKSTRNRTIPSASCG